MKAPKILMGVTALGLTACASYSAPPYGSAGYDIAGTSLITTGNKAPFGVFLVDAAGRSVYILEGTRGQTGMNRCAGDCLNVWPPVKATAPLTVGGTVDQARLTTVPGPWGPQAAYDGWPLYYYHHDRAPGDTTGQHVSDRWGTWHLLSPSGQPIRPTGSPGY